MSSISIGGSFVGSWGNDTVIAREPRQSFIPSITLRVNRVRVSIANNVDVDYIYPVVLNDAGVVVASASLRGSRVNAEETEFVLPEFTLVSGQLYYLAFRGYHRDNVDYFAYAWHMRDIVLHNVVSASGVTYHDTWEQTLSGAVAFNFFYYTPPSTGGSGDGDGGGGVHGGGDSGGGDGGGGLGGAVDDIINDDTPVTVPVIGVNTTKGNLVKFGLLLLLLLLFAGGYYYYSKRSKK